MRSGRLAPIVFLAAIASGVVAAEDRPRAGRPPNIVYILADDLGCGDVRCLNPVGKIATPNLDRLAKGGMAFTDMHSSSAVCTPTRYGILTGRYNWRTRLKSGVLNGYSRPLIEGGRLTVPALLGRHGYRTACVGKWHLGLSWPLKSGGIAEKDAQGAEVDYARPIEGGPTALGFDEFFGISASLDMPPYAFIEGDRTRGIPSVEKTWIRKGLASPDFEAGDVLPALADRAVGFLDGRKGEGDPGRPFFLYLALTAPHTPILPSPEWRGKSGVGPYGDFVAQVDAAVGRVVMALDRNKQTDDTLVIFTSDNGCSPAAGFPDLAAKGHDPSRGFRGTKADIFEGGHRIPFLVRWPGQVPPGTTSDQLACLTDLMATCAAILGDPLPAEAGEDSVSLLPALLGRAPGPLREAVVHHSIDGSFAIRQGPWKLELCAGSGGWSAPRPGRDSMAGLPPVQLYHLGDDPAERHNLQDRHPEVVDRLTNLLERYVAEGRSTPGPRQENAGPVEIRKATRPARAE